MKKATFFALLTLIPTLAMSMHHSLPPKKAFTVHQKAYENLLTLAAQALEQAQALHQEARDNLLVLVQALEYQYQTQQNIAQALAALANALFIPAKTLASISSSVEDQTTDTDTDSFITDEEGPVSGPVTTASTPAWLLTGRIVEDTLIECTPPPSMPENNSLPAGTL